MLSDWDKEKKQFLFPCYDALFDSLKGGINTGGAVSRTLPILPIKVDGGKLVFADIFVG